jgi:hypothetical protein
MMVTVTMTKYLTLGAVAAVAFSSLLIPVGSTRADDDEGYSFKVHNTTKDKITKLLASEDGKDYDTFDVGSKGIAPDETVTLKWDKTTDETGCEWMIKAVFADGSETDARKFDFCEKELELEF